jgi:hypothetical protein
VTDAATTAVIERMLVPPAEHDGHFYRHTTAAATVAASVPSLH